MRRLLWLVSATVFYNTIFLAALTPLLPLLARELDLSKSESGVLVASYAAGVLAAALPAGYAMARFGARGTLVLGLLLMAGSSVLFAFAPNVLLLDVALGGQGAASATRAAGREVVIVASPPGWAPMAATRPGERRPRPRRTAVAAGRGRRRPGHPRAR